MHPYGLSIWCWVGTNSWDVWVIFLTLKEVMIFSFDEIDVCPYDTMLTEANPVATPD